jgi:hypothetical protein
MALQKNVPLPSAVVARYHRIVGLFVLDAEKLCEIHLAHYLDEDTRRATTETDHGPVPTYQPAATSVVRLQGALFATVFGPGVPDYPSKDSLYAYLKTAEPQFAGAVDV